jgi:hypothetical protein
MMMKGALLFIFILFAILEPTSSQIRVSGADFIQNTTLDQFLIDTNAVPVSSIFTFNENGAANMSLNETKIPTAAQPRSGIFTFNEASTSGRSLKATRIPTGVLPRSSLFVLHETTMDQKDLSYPQEMLNDLVAPVISNVTAERSTAGESWINWTTDEFATGLVKYGMTAGDYSEDASDNLYQKNHSMQLQGLVEGTKYFVLVSGEDRSGNIADGIAMDFTA